MTASPTASVSEAATPSSGTATQAASSEAVMLWSQSATPSAATATSSFAGLRSSSVTLAPSFSTASTDFDGAEHHRHVAPVLKRRLLDDGDLGELLGQTVEQRRPALGVRDLAAAEHDRHLDPVLAEQEPLDVALLGVVVVLRDLGSELDLADRDLLLVLARGLLLLGLLVLVLGVVEHAAHGRTRIGCDLDQIEIALLGVGERLGGLDDADLLSVLAHEPNFGHADAVVDPSLVPIGRAPVKSARYRH